MEFFNKTAVITGGASGMGYLCGECLAKQGANVVLVDINEEMLGTCVDRIKELTGRDCVIGCAIDIRQYDKVLSVREKAVETFSSVDILINCAGIVRGNNTFDHQTVQDIRLTMDVNTIAPMVLALQVLPDMLSRNRGHICNIASAGGMLGNPKMSVYGASKWAVIGWSESMRIELQQQKSNVHVTTVAPYFISTGMFRGVRSVFPILKPEPTAKKILRAIERNTIFAGIPFGYHFIRFWQAILPLRVFDWLFGTVFGIYRTMDHFTGRK